MLKSALSRINHEFPAKTIQNGQFYFQKGHVLTIRLSDGLLRGRVKGSLGQIYDIYIDLRVWPAQPAQCTCAEGRNCKHIVACFFALQAKENLDVIPMAATVHSPISSKKIPDEIGDEIISADQLSWYSQVEETEQSFFSYQLGIVVDGQPISIVPLVVELLRTQERQAIEDLPDDKQMYLPLNNHKWLAISMGRIKPLLRLLLFYGLREHQQGDNLQLRQYQLSLMHEAEAAIQATQARWLGTEAVRKQLQRLHTLAKLPIPSVPKGLKTELRSYQLQGLAWLDQLRGCHFSGVLADDMGLGKTVQALALLQLEKERGHLNQPSLIIAPTSLVENWFDEAKRFTPDLKVLIFHGADRHWAGFQEHDVVISTYGTVVRDKALLIGIPFYYLILDEAQCIKNSRTKTTQIIQQLSAQHRLCLTGTPMENHLAELWSLFHFLMPGLLGDAKQYRQFFKIPIERQNNQERRKILAARVQPFMLRRTKNQVLSELPPKTEIVHMITLQGPQRDLYEAIRMTMEKRVRDAIAAQGIGRSHIVLLDALLKLRQVCCDPRLLSIAEAEIAYDHSAKLDALMTLLDSLIEEGRRVLIFSQFTSMLKLIEEVLQSRRYPYFKLTGQTQGRQALVDRFQAGEVPIFLISLKAGGTGLNLTRADTVILYDPWWNPAVQEQAAGRSHRIGQENPVFIYKLIAAGTVEEAILAMQVKKRELVDSILNNHTTAHHEWTMADIDYFFSPLD